MQILAIIGFVLGFIFGPMYIGTLKHSIIIRMGSKRDSKLFKFFMWFIKAMGTGIIGGASFGIVAKFSMEIVWPFIKGLM